jgi:methylphosphonate synthase
LRAAANDLKRDDRAAEADLGLAQGAFGEYLSGARPVTWEVIQRAAQAWPVSERDLLPLRNDCPLGVRVCRAAESLASARTLTRGGVPYYEYRDTAVSRLASYRPEWIRMLQVVTDSDPANHAVHWNNGHLLYQFTYFVGPVNYYYEWDGERYCVPMRTGDSVWGLPFGPHSFTARTAAEPAYILALTYGGSLTGDAQRELAALGPEASEAAALSPFGCAAAAAGEVAAGSGGGARDQAQAALLRSHLAARILPVGQVAARAGIPKERLRALVEGAAAPTLQELAAVATAVRVGLRELVPPRSEAHRGVVIHQRHQASEWEYPSGAAVYQVTELAGDQLHPNTTALELLVRGDGAVHGWITTHQHQYLYVLPSAPVVLRWEHRGTRHATRMEAAASAYVTPHVPIALSPDPEAASPEPPRVLLLRIAGAVGTETRFALGAMAAGGLERLLSEDRLWYDPAGSAHAPA